MAAIGPADLSIFLAIARHRSFRRAAVDLRVSPSALSHAVRGIEGRLGLRLFNRTTRSVALTEAGERLFARIRPAFHDIEDALEDLNSLRDEPAGTLRINAGRGSTRLVLLPVVQRFLAAYPQVRVEVATDNALVDMVSGGFDAGVRLGEIIAADMIAVPLGPRQRSAVVGSPAFFERWPKPLVPEQLRGLPCIRHRFDSGLYYAWEFARGGVEVSTVVDGPLCMTDQDMMLAPALAGTGLAYLFEAQVEASIAEGRLVRVLQDWCPYYPGFYLYYPSRRQMPLVLRAFLDFVRASAGPPPSSG
jgi:DNA-binding transcriptional LysR family regulator